MSESGKPSTPKWLRHLQENSWEAEILISGGAIFTLLTASDQFIRFIQGIKFSAAFTGLDQLALIIMVALKGITVGFIVHLIIRGLWISLVCLNYSFPNGINTGRLLVKGIYKSKAEAYSLTQEIVRLDKVSGIVFFSSLTFVLVVLGFLLMFTCMALCITGIDFIFDGTVLGLVIQVTLVVIPALLFVIDFVSGGLLRRNRMVAMLYRPFYVVFNVIGLAFIYRPWVQLIFSNVKRWKAALVITIFLMITAGYVNISLAKLFYWPSLVDQQGFLPSPTGSMRHNAQYTDLLGEDEMVFMACIPSEIIRDKYVKVFVPYRVKYDDGIRQLGKKYFSDIVSVSVDDSLYAAEWFNAIHPVTGQKGIFAMLSIESLLPGKHIIQIIIEDDYFDDRPTIIIPFWKD